MFNKRINETDLLRACVNGNASAFEAIVEKYQSFICAITFSAVGNVEKSEELAQETFINAWKNLAQLKDLSKFRAWLTSIARSVVKNSIRSQKRDLLRKAASLDQIQDDGVEGSKPSEEAITKEQQAVVQQALRLIPPKYREPLVLFYREQQSVRQVAEELDLSEETAKQRLCRGRKMLKEEVAAIVEKTISGTGPSKVFTTAVIASVAGLVIKGSGVVVAAGIATASSTTGTATGVAAIMSGITVKIITAAAAVAIGVGAVVTYKHVTKPSPGPELSQTAVIAREQGDETNSFSAEVTTEVGGDDYQQAESAKDDSPAQAEQESSRHVNGISNQAEAKTGISGVVIDKSTSKPIKGAKVFYGSRKKPDGSFLTDANGHFEFPEMKPRARQFFYIVAKNYTTRRITLDIIKDKVYENFKIELTGGSKVAGIVYDQDGKPVKRATVATFHFTNHPVITDANGTFEIDGLDPAWSQYQFHATHPNYPASSTSFSPANAGETVWRDVVLKPGVIVCGQVTDAKGNPVANVDVGNTTSRSMWNCIKAKTDQEGKYELKNVEVGELVLWAVINEYAPYVERFSLDSSEAKKLINIQLSGPLPLHGKIVDKQGNPVPGVSIGIREYKGVSNLANRRDRVTSDSDGKFIIPNAPPTGMVILSVGAKQVPYIHPKLEAGQEEEYIIEVNRTGRIYGKVVDAKTDTPVRKFNVKLTFSKNESKRSGGYSATWNREGHNFDSSEGFFDTGRENIPIGAEYAVTVYADGFDPLTIDPVVVQPISSDPNRAEFKLKPPTVLAGRVVDSNGMPIVGARIRFMTDDNEYEHWDDRDTSVTNSRGEFNLAGIGTGQRCIYITAETFAPYFGSSEDMPKNSEGTIQITLEPGAEVFGRVVDANGQGIGGVKISTHLFPEQRPKMLSYPWHRLKETHTDVDGYYELFDLPAGSVSISVNSSIANGNLNLAQKKVTLKKGQSIELNFGGEVGFTLAGVVRTGEKLLEKANIQIHFPDQSTKLGRTDTKGRFRITGVPKGTYTVYTNYHSGLFDPKTVQWRVELSDNRQVTVNDNIELDIDFGDGSVSGEIPEQFVQSDKLRITGRRWAPKKPQGSVSASANWEYAKRAEIDSEGNFICPNLRAGRYYFSLTTESGTSGISDVLELNESEHIEGVTFNIGSGTIKLYVVDLETSEGIPNAGFVIKNDLETTFYSKELVPEGRRLGMITDDEGKVEYTDLPKGKYIVRAQAAGYLTNTSEWIEVNDGQVASVTVPLELAAVVRFELSSQVQQRITADTVYLRCRVANVDTDELVPTLTYYREFDEHMIWLVMKNLPEQYQPTINLPEGRYEIEYRLYQDRTGRLSYQVQTPLLERTVNVEVYKGETKLITVSKIAE